MLSRARAHQHVNPESRGLSSVKVHLEKPVSMRHIGFDNAVSCAADPCLRALQVVSYLPPFGIALRDCDEVDVVDLGSSAPDAAYDFQDFAMNACGGLNIVC